jgi:hypothetical protein
MLIKSARKERLQDDRPQAFDRPERQYAQGGVAEMVMSPPAEQRINQAPAILGASTCAAGAQDFIMLQLASFEGRANR